jgi:lysophospholipase L1-like esterase/plastocyanin domain-containing protein
MKNTLFKLFSVLVFGFFCSGAFSANALAQIIIDNDGPGSSYSGGPWGYSSGANPYNGSSRAESQDGATYTFQAAVSGAHAVSLWWTWWSSRCSSVPVDIYNGSQLLATVSVNQQQQGLAGQWNGIGTYQFTGTARVVIRARSGCSTCADAVRFVSAEQAPSQSIIDNDGPGTSYSGGAWGYSSGANPYNGTSRAESLNGATYTFQSAASGAHTVSLWWTWWSSRCSSVPVDIYNGSQLLATVSVNQQQQSLAGQWNGIGTYQFTGTARVVIRARSGCSTCADAVRFVTAGELVLDDIAIEGPDEVVGNTSAQYVLRAYYTNGTSQLVAAASWAVSCPSYAQISDTGLLTAFNVSGAQSCTITASYGENSTLLEDAVSILIKDVAAPTQVIIDNDDPGTSYSGGFWGYSSGANPYNGSSRAESLNGATYTYQAAVSGYQTISLWWTYWSSRCASVPVSIYRGNQLLSTVSVNQQQQSLAGKWNVIGTYAFAGTARVVISAKSGCSSCADAIRFEYAPVGADNYYVAFGDSITFGVGDDDPSDDTSLDGQNSGGGYTPILNDLLTNATKKSHFIANEGVGRATSSDGRSSISDVLAAHSQSGRFLVQYGTNDANPLFPMPSGKGLSPGNAGYPGSFKDNMQQIINVINVDGKEASLAKIPITLGSTTTGEQYIDPDAGVRNVLIKEYNEVIDELKNNSLNKITVTPPDFYNLFNEDVIGGKRYDFEYADNLHPNGEGYRSMAHLWFESLTP